MSEAEIQSWIAPAGLSIRETFAGKHVLLTGASGFLGKVWLAMMLEHAPELGRVHLLMRPRALVGGQARFEKMVNTSPAFRRLHERFGPALSRMLTDKIEVIEGELSEPELGASGEALARLRPRLDLVVHCAGLVDFNPDLRKALACNVDSALHVADFVESCDHAALLHVSTSYVAGRRSGEIPEELQPEYSPCGDPLDAARELEEAREAAARVCRRHESAAHRAQVHAEVEELVRERRGDNPKLVENLTKRRLREDLKHALRDEGMSRARKWGWPNTYTYTKSLAESLLVRRGNRIRFSVFRPSIVESSLEFPFPGWNESFNGSAPLAYVMSTWFRLVPARPDAPFDVIPVDQVCKAMAIAGAALLSNLHSPVYQIGTSARNRCSVGRAAELIVLAHRRHYRERGRRRNEQVFKSRWDAVLTGREPLLGVQNHRALLRTWLEALDLLPAKVRRKLKRAIDRAEHTESRLAQVEELVGLYLPFMFESFYVFECRAIERTPALEPEFKFEPEAIDWRKYWLEVHVPGLRRWAFPLIEGKRPEKYRAQHPVVLGPPTPSRQAVRSVAEPVRATARAEVSKRRALGE